jgi:hypothetical protein
LRHFFALKNLILLEKSNRGCTLVLPTLGANSRARPHGAMSLQALQTIQPPFHPLHGPIGRKPHDPVRPSEPLFGYSVNFQRRIGGIPRGTVSKLARQSI